MIYRRYPIGAESQASGVHFRVWAPDRHRIAVRLDDQSIHQLTAEENGYFSGLVLAASVGRRYQIQLDDQQIVPDPASRYQPDGPHGPSQIIDPNQFSWSDSDWTGRDLAELVIYEMHVGTFTSEGTWKSAANELHELARWASRASRSCRSPNSQEILAGDMTESIFSHQLICMEFPTIFVRSSTPRTRSESRSYSMSFTTTWGRTEIISANSPRLTSQVTTRRTGELQSTLTANILEAVREFFLTNAAYWIQEFHLDGLRLDATQNIYDDSPPGRHILTAIGRVTRAAAPNRKIILIAENEPQQPDLCRSVQKGGNGLDAVWNDDFHHSAMVALTGHNEAYYTDYLGNPQEFISAAKYGYLYQGQWYHWQNKRRGQSGRDLSPAAFICFLQNHDQVANSGRGWRAHRLSSLARYRTMMSLTMFMPGTPMLFQGQEFAASTPFLFFADHQPELASMVQTGRSEFLSQFPRLQDERMIAQFAPPHDPQTFLRCKLEFAERTSHASEYLLTRDLLRLRRKYFALQGASPRAFDGAVIGPRAFLLRYFRDDGQDCLLLVNFGIDLNLSIAPEPLMAPPAGMEWQIQFSSEDPQYGGQGVRSPEIKKGGWFLTADTAMVLGGQRLIECRPKFKKFEIKIDVTPDPAIRSASESLIPVGERKLSVLAITRGSFARRWEILGSARPRYEGRRQCLNRHLTD